MICETVKDLMREGYIRVSGGLNEEEAAMNTSVLNITLSLSGEFLAEIGGMLILDVLHDRIPTTYHVSFQISKLMLSGFGGIPSIIVHLITVAWGINNVQPKANTIFLDDFHNT